LLPASRQQPRPRASPTRQAGGAKTPALSPTAENRGGTGSQYPRPRDTTAEAIVLRGDPTLPRNAEAVRGRAGQESEGLYRVLSTRGCCAHAKQRARASLGVGSSFRASAARYRLGWPSPIRLQPLHEHEVRAGSWRLPAATLNGITIVNPARPSLMDLPSPSESFTSEPPSAMSIRRPAPCKGSPHELLGPFSTSRREDSPARGSRPTVVRLRRWSDLGGLLPSRPCRLVSSGGTLGVPDCVTSETLPEGKVTR